MEEQAPIPKPSSNGTENRIFAALSYASILFVIPLILKHDDDYVYFHARQGMALFLAEVVVWFVVFMLESFVVAIAPRSSLDIMGALGALAWVFFVAVSLIWAYFAFVGREKEMPFLGRIARGLKV